MQVLKQEIYDSIKKNSLQLFKKFSYEEVNINEIATTSNISTGNVYRYYKNKRDVYDKVTEKAYEMLEKTADEMLERKDIQIENIINKIIDIYKEEKSATIILLGVKNTINKELIKKYEKIFIKIFKKDEDNYLNEIYAKSIFYAFRIIIDKELSSSKLNDSFLKFIKNY